MHTDIQTLDIESTADGVIVPMGLKVDIEILKQIVREMIDRNIIELGREKLEQFIKEMQRIHHVSIGNSELLYAYNVMAKQGLIPLDKKYETLLQTRTFRSQSGVIVIATVMSPYPNGQDFSCQWNCKYCPLQKKIIIENARFNDEGIINFSDTSGDVLVKFISKDIIEVNAKQITLKFKNKTGKFEGTYNKFKFELKYDEDKIKAEISNLNVNEPMLTVSKNQPRSYLEEEPGVLRANRYNFDPVLQFRNRGFSYIVNGHPVDKIELIILGGTWDSYPKDYQEWYIKMSYYAANTFFDSHKVENLRPVKSLDEEIKENESAQCKIIGITIETRPDCINRASLLWLRRLTITRIQMGVQHLDKRLLDRVDRMCDTKHVIYANKLIRSNCGKLDAHLMPSLANPLKKSVKIIHKKEDGVYKSYYYRDTQNKFLNRTSLSTSDIDFDQYLKDGLITEKLEKQDIDFDFDVYKADKEMFLKVASHEDFQFDQIKNYPLDILKDAVDLHDEYMRGLIELYSEVPHVISYWDKFLLMIYNILIWFNMLLPSFLKFKLKKPNVFSGKKYSKPYTKIYEILIWFETIIPPWIRINRVKRDNPSQYIVGGSKDGSMRQVIDNEMKLRDLRCMDIRSREVKKQKIDPQLAKLFVTIYRASEGTEFFLSYETIDRSILFGFLRLRFNDNNNYVYFDELLNAALIRELHVYGQTVSVNDKTQKDTSSQHKGFGTKLLNMAFKISKENGYNKIAVISGVGVRNYYRKFGFTDEPHFLVKTFAADESFVEFEKEKPIIIDCRNKKNAWK